MAVKLDDLRQPRGIGGLPVVIGRGQAVFCGDECWQDKEEGGGDELRHGLRLPVTRLPTCLVEIPGQVRLPLVVSLMPCQDEDDVANRKLPFP